MPSDTPQQNANNEPVAPQPIPEPSHLMVEVQGAVAQPGIYELPAGARIADALTEAGGTTEAAEIRDVNLAARLDDGSVLSIPFSRQSGYQAYATAAQLNPPQYTRSGWNSGVGEMGTTRNDQPAVPSTDCLDLNTASQSALETLPGVGPKTAEKIIRYREQHPFSSVQDLLNIPGIGDKRLESLASFVCVP